MSTKIENDYLSTFNNSSNTNYFGDWINDLNKLNIDYKNAKPFEHIIIPNFLNKDFAELIYNKFPEDFENWHKYYNPIEIKYADDDINNMDENIKKLFYVLCTDKSINIFSKISDIDNLEYDPYLHGAGLHAHPRNGRLHMHLDYVKHPYPLVRKLSKNEQL